MDIESKDRPPVSIGMGDLSDLKRPNSDGHGPNDEEKNLEEGEKTIRSGNITDQSDPHRDVACQIPSLSLSAPEDGTTGTGSDGHEGDVTSNDVPDGGYGWVVVGCLIAMNASTWGMNTTYGVFTAYYMKHNYFEGGSNFRYAWVGGFGVATAQMSGPLGNYLCRKFGMRVPMILGVICVVLGQCLAGICTHYATFLITQGFLFGLGLGLMLITTSPILAHWFDRRLSLAQGLANGGSGLGGLIFANTTRLTLETLGVKWALIINGMISLVVLIPVCILLKGRHKALQARSMSLEWKWFVHPGFIWILLWASFSMITYFVSLYSLASFATSGLGLSQKKGASLQSILSAAQMIGRPTVGFLLDRGGRINMSFLTYIVVGIACLAIWLPATSYGVLILFALIIGATSGTVYNASTPLAAQMIGIQHLGSALSVFWISLGIPALVGQPLAILLLNYSEQKLGRTGPAAYYNSIGFAGAMGIASALMLLGAKRYQQGNWKVFTKS